MSENYRRAAQQHDAPWKPELTRTAVLNRDQWTCKMDICLYGDRQIDPGVLRRENGPIPDEGGSVDHIVPLAVPHTPGHVPSNVRAAHRACNRGAAGLLWYNPEVVRTWVGEHAPAVEAEFTAVVRIVRIAEPGNGPPLQVVIVPTGDPESLAFVPGQTRGPT